MNAEAILDWLAKEGFSVSEQGDDLFVIPPKWCKMKPIDIAAIKARVKANKKAILEYLRSKQITVDWPLQCVTTAEYVEIAKKFGVSEKEACDQAVQSQRFVSEVMCGGEFYLVRG